jgi:DnaJ-class molecular chaperone
MKRSDIDTPKARIEKALECMQLPHLVTKEDVKRQYRYLSKKYHPDVGGDAEKMQCLSEAYDTLMRYIENFRYRFDDEEIANQFPGAEHADRFKP